MLRKMRPTPALVVAVAALFVALGGTGYAAVSVTGRNVRDGSLTGRDIRNGSVTSGDIKDGTLRGSDFHSGVLSTGSRGPAGPTGAKGATGPAGPAGAAGSALAFGHIAANATADAGATKNIAVVSNPSAGVYCLNYTAGTPTNIVMTIDNSGADPSRARVGGTAVAASVATSCPAGADISVATSDDTVPGRFANEPFYIAVIG
jgi:hypothetical protein